MNCFKNDNSRIRSLQADLLFLILFLYIRLKYSLILFLVYSHLLFTILSGKSCGLTDRRFGYRFIRPVYTGFFKETVSLVICS